MIRAGVTIDSNVRPAQLRRSGRFLDKRVRVLCVSVVPMIVVRSDAYIQFELEFAHKKYK